MSDINPLDHSRQFGLEQLQRAERAEAACAQLRVALGHYAALASTAGQASGDFLDEIVAARTKRNPAFPRLVLEAQGWLSPEQAKALAERLYRAIGDSDWTDVREVRRELEAR